MRGRAALVGTGAFVERLLAPALVYLFFYTAPAVVLGAGASLAVLIAARASMQRSFATRNEAELYRLVVDAILQGDVLSPSVLPDQEARGSLFEGVNRIANVFADSLPGLVANSAAAGVLGGVLLSTQPVRMTMLALAIMAVLAAAMFGLRRWIAQAQSDAWSAWDRVAESMNDAFDGRLDLVAAGTDGDFLSRFEGIVRSWDSRARRAGRLAGLMGRIPVAVAILVAAAIVIADALRHGSSWAAAGLRMGLLAGAAPAYFGASRNLQELVTNQERLRLIERVVGGRSGTNRTPGVRQAAPSLVEVRSLRFAYTRHSPDVLHDVSLVWRVGGVLALAGPNGSGKSTCLRAILGLGVIRGGDVLIDGCSIAHSDVRSWRRTIAYLPQRPYLPPSATVRECLCFLDANIDDQAMQHALRRVGLSEHVVRLGERVGNLSVGERQRVALARVLCRDAPVIMLDEPDANLDRDGIRLISELVGALARDRMVMVAAHTPELLEGAGLVVHLNVGRLEIVPA